jgi:hypothetical protein
LTLPHVASKLPVVDGPQTIIAMRSRTAWSALAFLLVGAGGCYQSYVEPDDVEVDDVGIGDDSATDTGDVSEAGASVCVGGWYDPSSGLCWQDPLVSWVNWREALDYCNGLSLGGHGPGSWHLPTIGELRSLIRGCPDAQTGGSCTVTDACFDHTCWDGSCWGCSPLGGSGADGVYWPPELRGTDGTGAFLLWSSSAGADGPGTAWVVLFGVGGVRAGPTGDGDRGNVRCVRPGP